MSILRSQIRPGVYLDSIVLMQLQSALAGLSGVEDAGVVMGTDANRSLLRASGLFTEEAAQAGNDDLVVVLRAESEEAAQEALERVDGLLSRRRSSDSAELRPRSLETAIRSLPEARWVLISVPGRWAAGVARQALEKGRHVFLYSDNVSLEDEVALKGKAWQRGLLVMGPDCGTASIAGKGLGFANRVREGRVGLVAASGTGLQAVASRLDQLGAGVSHALGTGGRDLSRAVGAVTARQALDLLLRDAGTDAVVVISKPPDAEVGASLLAAARQGGKPVVVYFLGQATPIRRLGNLHLVSSLSEAAEVAAGLVAGEGPSAAEGKVADPRSPLPPGRYLRGLFAGGTLAFEAVQALDLFLAPLVSNVPLRESQRLEDPSSSRGHTILDLGADELTVGRLHPMLDPELRLRRLAREAEDPETGLLLLDVVLGDGAQDDPAADLAPALAQTLAARREAGNPLEAVVLVVGTEGDPQGLKEQVERLEETGATVFRDPLRAFEHVALRFAPAASTAAAQVDAACLDEPFAAINVGLESFHDSLVAQGASVVQVEWRPPAGGDGRLAALLERMRS